jgi:hypothetical protein
MPGARYVSKNNANIIRISTLSKMFPDGIILVPFRHPLAHADSLLRMHKRFKRMHKEQPFSRRYMEHLGHYEFGETFRPINFDNWLNTSGLSPDMADFWLAYWIASFRHLLKNTPQNIAFLSYERCCAEPQTALGKLSGVLELRQPQTLLDQAQKYRAPRSFDLPDYAPALKEESLVLYQALLDRSSV